LHGAFLARRSPLRDSLERAPTSAQVDACSSVLLCALVLAQLCLDGREPVMLGRINVLLRGCQLRNTEWVLGLVLSTGTDAKINFSEETAPATKHGHTMQASALCPCTIEDFPARR
jgi:magnesium-transporting ATPase (P-type)